LPVLLDTDVAIELSYRAAWIKARIARLTQTLNISVVTCVELENGVHREPLWTSVRQPAVDQLLLMVIPLDFGSQEIAAYRRILEVTGYSRRKVADRMTAATALVHRLPLVTLNGRDFRDVPELELIEWERP
jgi:tRNA(fMet)-specific endonuclease VapC